MSREGGTTYNKAPSATGIDIERKVYIGPSPTLQSGSATAGLRLCYPPPFLARAPHLTGRTERHVKGWEVSTRDGICLLVGPCASSTAMRFVPPHRGRRCAPPPQARERGSPSLPLFGPRSLPQRGKRNRKRIYMAQIVGEGTFFFLSLLPVPSQPSFLSLPTSQVKRSPIPAGGPIVCSDPS